MKISRQAYADIYGPTVGDRVRLGDTELWIEVEKDATCRRRRRTPLSFPPPEWPPWKSWTGSGRHSGLFSI